MLKRLELIVHGLAPGDLASQSRTLVRQVGLVPGDLASLEL